MSNYPDNFRGLPGEDGPEYSERLNAALEARRAAKFFCDGLLLVAQKRLAKDDVQSVADYLADMMGDTFEANVQREAETFRLQTGYEPNV